MATFALNQNELEFINEEKSILLEFFDGVWVALDVSESQKCLRDLINRKSKSSPEKVKIIDSLINKISLKKD